MSDNAAKPFDFEIRRKTRLGHRAYVAGYWHPFSLTVYMRRSIWHFFAARKRVGRRVVRA